MCLRTKNDLSMIKMLAGPIRAKNLISVCNGNPLNASTHASLNMRYSGREDRIHLFKTIWLVDAVLIPLITL